jgi:hypothetical protein
MITTSETNSRFTIRDFPFFRLLGAGACLVLSLPIGIVLIIQLPFPPPARSFPLIGAVIVSFCCGAGLLVTGRFRITTIDRSVQTISVSIRGLFGSEYRTYKFSDLAKSFGGLRVNTDYRTRKWSEYKVYGIQLPLVSGDEVDLTDYAWFQLNGCKSAVERAGQYINDSVQ